MMSNRQLAREIKEFVRIRQEWVDILVKNPRHNQACQMILSINAKIELLETHWNWSDESVDIP
jgi:hypothetical protein